ncbi:MAG: alpha/beta hydrolase [Fimbriimonadaceae bacterium]|nr:alpha/beta hydrolase [Fimbriimonadaceae bacterium]
MTTIFVCYLGIMGGLASSSPHQPQDRATQSTPIITRDVEFTKAKVEGGEKSLKLDVYQPAGEGPFPAMVIIHGGGFVGGNKGGMMGQLGRYFAGRGITCFDIQYRLQGDNPPTKGAVPIQRAIAAAVEDADTALHWVVSNAKTYKVDPKRIAIGGSSAGSITALLVTYGETRSTVPVKCVVNLWGSMYQQVGSLKKGDVPFLLVHGADDKIVPFSYGEQLMKQADKVGVRYEKFVLEGGGHGMALSTKVGDITLDEFIYRFLKKELGG